MKLNERQFKSLTTAQLTNELVQREGVEEYVIGPHGESARLYLYDGDQEGTHSYIEIDGPARIIINKD